MSLSEQELRALQEIEQSLLAEDPKFGASVSAGAAPSGVVTLRGVALIAVGLVMLVGGVALAQHSMWFVTLSILGFLLMFGAGVWMLRNGGGKSAAAGAQPSQPKAKAPGMGMRLEDNFRRRFEDGQSA